ncbi:ASST-domain-containing protein [Talaromyces proteolyticus]|uniref:ASST-domain-containing protein n=1 Tax=Talaromyces proteolyticus TaxID=1131652 RepID=A0AAD4KDV8_9EURO|nr:ASST-domain-containing protein [Talaromyces proteolyticus]KAH8689494.1 ASST-domain-containing protein [Talaromyces proteolyticus]
MTSTLSTFASLTALLCLQAPLSLASNSHHVRHHNHHARASSICATSAVNVVDNSTTFWPFQTFQSFGSTPPQLNITTNGKELGDGLLFFSPGSESGQGKPKEVNNFIMTSAGELVWANPNPRGATDIKVQTLDGEPVFTYYTPVGPQSFAGIGWGEVHVVDKTYTEIYTICPQLNLTKGDGVTSICDSDLHEHYITPENTMYVTAFNLTQWDLTSVGGTANDWVIDALAVEVDIKSGNILSVWSALDHIPTNQSHAGVPKTGVPKSGAIDLYHMNSIQSYGDYMLINCRHTWSTYLVNRKTGEIEWTIDGQTGGDFGSLPANGTFKWQHHARITNVSATEAILTYFNNDNNQPGKVAVSTGLALQLTLPPNPKTPPKLLASLHDASDPLNAWAEGSTMQLSNGNWFMGYGSSAIMKEYGPDAATGQDVRWSAQFDSIGGGDSYRAFKQVWHGLPTIPPSFVVAQGEVPAGLSGCTNATNATLGYVSWNGATDVSSYSLYGGASEDDMQFLGAIRKMGFETVFPITQDVSYVMVSGSDPTLNVERNSTVVKI